MSCLSFGEVRRNGDRRASHLSRQPEFLFRGKVLGQSINALRQFDSLLPNQQVFIVLGTLIHNAVVPACSQLVTDHWSLITFSTRRPRHPQTTVSSLPSVGYK